MAFAALDGDLADEPPAGPSHGEKKCYQIDASLAEVGGCASIQHSGNTGRVVLNDPVDGDAAIIY